MLFITQLYGALSSPKFKSKWAMGPLRFPQAMGPLRFPPLNVKAQILLERLFRFRQKIAPDVGKLFHTQHALLRKFLCTPLMGAVMVNVGLLGTKLKEIKVLTIRNRNHLLTSY